ncbi:MAG: LPS assembly protein LptD [Verrucomicrobiota bacterium]|nr:LPS assembly protein LptD [Verrucomicrobiota bacterium]
MRKLIALIILLGATLLPSALLRAAAPQITASENFYDSALKASYFRGNAVLTHDDFNVEADEIAYFQAEGKAVATGNVRVTQLGFRLVCRQLTYFPDKKEFASEDFRVGAPPFIITGKSFSGSQKHIRFTEAEIFLNEPGPEVPSAAVSGGSFYPGDRIELENVKFGAFGVRVLKLRRFTQGVNDPAIRFTGDVGIRKNLGAYFQTETLFPMGKDLHLGAMLDAYTGRGGLIGPALDYSKRAGDLSVDTEFRGGYIHDFGSRGADVLWQPVPKNRYYLDLRNKLAYGDNFWINTQFTRWSDSEFTRDFRSKDFRNNQQPDNFLDATYIWKNTYLSLFTRVDTNDFYNVGERLPELRIDHSPTELIKDTGILHSYSASYVNLRNQYYIMGTPTLGMPYGYVPRLGSFPSVYFYAPVPVFDFSTRYDRFDFNYNLRRPMNLGSWLTVTPVAGVRVTHYELSPSTRYFLNYDSFTRWLGQLGGDAEVHINGQWAVDSKTWGIDGIRHRLTPFAQYRWLPNGDRDNYRGYRLDHFSPVAYAQEIDIEANRNIDFITYTNVVRYGFRNVVETKTKEGSRELLRFDLFQDYNFEPWPGQPNWEGIYGRATIMPARWLSLGYEQKIRTENFKTEYDRYSITVTDADLWSVTLFTEYLHPDMPSYYFPNNASNLLEQYGADVFYKLSDKWGVRFYGLYDANLNKLIENRYSLRQRIGRSWDIEYEVSFRDNNARDDGIGFSISLAYIRF